MLETERLILRKPCAADWPSVKEFFMSDRAQYVGGPYTLGKAWRQFAAEIGHWDMLGFGMFTVVEKSGQAPIGLVGAWCPEDWPETEIGWFVFAGAEGKGYAFEAAQAAVAHAWDDLGWDTIVSYIAPENTRSIALATRLGATLDPDAPQPKPDQPCLVYRHPKGQS